MLEVITLVWHVLFYSVSYTNFYFCYSAYVEMFVIFLLGLVGAFVATCHSQSGTFRINH